jgi:hypothetical protein
MNYRTTRHPLEIGSWGPLRHLHARLRGPKGYTYPNPVLLAGEHDTLYLLWRGTDWSQDYATRSSDGRWSAARRLISVPGERPYVKVARVHRWSSSHGPDEHLLRGVPERGAVDGGRPANRPRRRRADLALTGRRGL